MIRRASREDGSPRCAWCEAELSGKRSHAKFCGQRCRQASHRFGVEAVARRRATVPMRIAYADPPYPGLAHRYYADHPDYAGEVDHAALLSRLQAFDAWALSTSSDALPEILAMCVARSLEVRVGAWFRSPRASRSYRARCAWEPVVYAGARRYSDEASREACPDALIHAARPRTTDPRRVMGAKPAAFAFWLFDLLGARPGDHFVDLFPGSGGIARAWSVYEARSVDAGAERRIVTSREARRFDPSARAPRDVSPPGEQLALGIVDGCEAAE